MTLKEKIMLYKSLYEFLNKEGLKDLEKKTLRENVNDDSKQLILNLPDPDKVKIDEHFIVSFATEIISGHLESLYGLEFKNQYLHIYARLLLDAEDLRYQKDDRPETNRHLTEKDIVHVRTHYSNYAKKTYKSSRSNTVITQTDMGLELSFLMCENNEMNSIIYPLSREAHAIVGGDATKQLDQVSETIIKSVTGNYKASEVQFVIYSSYQNKYHDYRSYMYDDQNVIKDINTLFKKLSDLEKIMLERFDLFQTHQTGDLKMFNHLQTNTQDKLPYIVVMIEDIQLDGNDQKERFEDLIMRLTQRSREAGIHLVMLTSNPINSISKKFGYFIPNRVAFRLSQVYQSKALLGNDKACYLKHQEYICETYQHQNKFVKRI